MYESTVIVEGLVMKLQYALYTLCSYGVAYYKITKTEDSFDESISPMFWGEP